MLLIDTLKEGDKKKINVDKRGKDMAGMKWRCYHEDHSPWGNSCPSCAADYPGVGRGNHPCLSPTVYASLFIPSQGFITACMGQKKNPDFIMASNYIKINTLEQGQLYIRFNVTFLFINFFCKCCKRWWKPPYHIASYCM